MLAICISQYFNARFARSAHGDVRSCSRYRFHQIAASAWLAKPLQEQRQVEHGIGVVWIGIERTLLAINRLGKSLPFIKQICQIVPSRSEISDPPSRPTDRRLPPPPCAAEPAADCRD